MQPCLAKKRLNWLLFIARNITVTLSFVNINVTHSRQPRSKLSDIRARLARNLKTTGILFMGLNVIGGFSPKINITSPTGLRAYKNLGGPDLTAKVWEAIESRR